MKVVCIDITTSDDLTLNKSYEVLEEAFLKSHEMNVFRIIDDHNVDRFYFSNRFISLTDFRKLKLKKIEDESNMQNKQRSCNQR